MDIQPFVLDRSLSAYGRILWHLSIDGVDSPENQVVGIVHNTDGLFKLGKSYIDTDNDVAHCAWLKGIKFLFTNEKFYKIERAKSISHCIVAFRKHGPQYEIETLMTPNFWK